MKAGALLWLAGCSRGPGGGRAAEATRRGMLLKGNGTEPESLDPHVVRGGAEWTIMAALFEGLTVPDPVTLEPRPGVAERWEVSSDGLVWTFHLRESARWSNGDPVTAEDFAWSARRMIHPALGSAHVEDTLLFVRGVREAIAEPQRVDAIEIQALDTRVLRVRLENPTPFFASAMSQFYPVHRATLEKWGGVSDRASAWTKPGNLVGNGPFALRHWVQNQELVVEKSSTYWDAGAVRLQGITFFPFENPATEETAFRNGQLHLTSSLPLQKIEVYEREAPDQLRIVPDLGNYFYTLNVNRPPFSDVRVRQAFSLATDRESLVRRVVKGGKRAANAFTPSGIGGYTATPALVLDPEKARQRLDEAGFPGGRGFPAVELTVDARDSHRVVAEALQQMWERTLGVRVAIRAEETRVLISSKRAMQFDLIRGSWNANTYQDPWYFLGPWTTGGLYNEAKWSNTEYDGLIAQAQEQRDPALRLGLLQQAEWVFLRELPVLPLYWGTQVYLASPSVQGLAAQAFADRAAKSLWLE